MNLIKIKDELLLLYNKYNTRFSLTFDGWTASNQAEYLGVTIHYINNEWELVSKLIGMEDIKKRYTASYIYMIINALLTDLDIKDKILS